MEREKKIISGPLMEIDFYPVFSDGRRMPSRQPKTKPSSEAQRKYNQTQAIKKFVRLVNANFDNSDYFMHPTYDPKYAPQDEQKARRDMVNYIRRVKTKRTSELKKSQREFDELKKILKSMPNNKYLQESAKVLKKRIRKLSEPLKYIYVIEKKKYQRGEFTGKANWHFHLFITGGIDNRDMENLWNNGMRTNCNNYQPEKFGPEAAAVYMSKDPQGAKRFAYSRNLSKPKEKIMNNKLLNRRRVAQIATERVDDASFWEKRYKGYKFIRCFARYNGYNAHWYVTAIMYKSGTVPPDWKTNEWITSDGEI